MQINFYLKPQHILSHASLCYRLSGRSFQVRRVDYKSLSQQVNQRNQKLDVKGKPHPGCNNWFNFITFSSIDLQRKIKIFNPTGKAVLARCAWTTIKSQANILLTTPGLPQCFHIKAPEDKCTDQCVHFHQSSLQVNKKQFLLFHKPYFSATPWAWMGRPRNITARALWSFF